MEEFQLKYWAIPFNVASILADPTDLPQLKFNT